MKEVSKERALSVTENIKVGTFLKRPLPLGYDSHYPPHMTQSQVSQKVCVPKNLGHTNFGGYGSGTQVLTN